MGGLLYNVKGKIVIFFCILMIILYKYYIENCILSIYVVNINLYYQNGFYSKEFGVYEVYEVFYQVLCVGVYIEEDGGICQVIDGFQKIDVSKESICCNDNNIVLSFCGFQSLVFLIFLFFILFCY